MMISPACYDLKPRLCVKLLWLFSELMHGISYIVQHWGTQDLLMSWIILTDGVTPYFVLNNHGVQTMLLRDQ
jgi:hypothetical protein